MNINKTKMFAIILASASVMTSCGIYSTYKTPTDGVLAQYAQAKEAEADTTALGNLPWEQVFTDPTLQGYIRMALDNNNDLKNAKLNVDIAQAQLLGAKLSYLPSLTFAPNGSGSAVGNSGLSWGYQLPLSLSWELDIFGSLRNSKRSAQAAVYQSQAYKQAVQSQIIGGVANAYYALVSLHNQLRIYNETAMLWGETVQTMKDMKESGRGYTEAAVVQSEAARYGVQSAIPAIEISITQLNNTLSLLVGEQATSWAVNTESSLSLPSEIAAGVPMNYLANRPDVQAAEQSLAMAYYATNKARSSFYPNITLSVNGGYGTLIGSAILDPAKWFYSLAGQLAAPLFARGQRIAGLKAAKAQQEQALNNFKYAVLSAGTEVQEALVTITKTTEKQKFVAMQADKLQKAVEVNNDLLKYSNSATYLEVLTAQQNFLNAQISVEDEKLSANQAVINLYQALGGGR